MKNSQEIKSSIFQLQTRLNELNILKSNGFEEGTPSNGDLLNSIQSKARVLTEADREIELIQAKLAIFDLELEEATRIEQEEEKSRSVSYAEIKKKAEQVNRLVKELRALLKTLQKDQHSPLVYGLLEFRWDEERELPFAYCGKKKIIVIREGDASTYAKNNRI